ncbi:pyruvate kinase [Ruminococcus flavefaciens]|uniref:pyruvate kinase n=1 Tax=Ruminococcus flavefaciens TaxID=1265 RepID=UPI0013DA62CB|nr:pyruvate kinase [Ruminococcus flavefaciens]
MRKTKIVCTIGPATDDENIMRELMLAGMNVARFNFSHGDYETHEKRFRVIEKLRKELDLPVATLLDTKGPEIRLGKFVDDKPVEIHDGDTYTLTTEDVLCDDKMGSISFKKLPRDVSMGTRILINDGVIELLAEKVTTTEIVCRVVHGGTLSNNKGINVPGVKLSMPYLSERDMDDLEFGSKMGFDFIAASFVRTAADINYLRKFTQSLGWFDVRIIAKIENTDGVENIDEILEAADGIMVARGDMGVEIPFEQIPAIQKSLIKKGYNAGKQVITATQMLESMITNPRPTRAEITDVANALYDGTSAIMLSGETAAGAYPVEAVKTMALIAETTENNINYKARFSSRRADQNGTVAEAIAHATVTTAHDLNARAIITVSLGGQTARLISKYRPSCPIISCTMSEVVCRQMNMSWGVIPFIIDEKTNTDDLFAAAVEAAESHRLVEDGDLVAITAGVPLGVSGTTNLMKVEKIGGK